MRLPKDILNAGLYTKPNFFLCQTDKEKICKLETTETKCSFKFNAVSELSFETARVYNDVITGETKVNPYFDKIEALRLIYVDGLGYFELQGPELVSDGIEEKKSCTAYSLEYTLAQKYLEDFYINMGTVESLEVLNASSEKDIVPITLYNKNNPKLSLLHLVLDEIYGWKIGHVDTSLQTLSRQFDIDRESVYDFLMNEVCEKFNCYIVFDTINNTINLYAESLTAKFIGDGKTNSFIISPPFAQIGTVSVDGYKTTRWEYNASTGVLTLEDVPDSGAHIEIIDGALTEWETDVFVSFENLAQEVNINYDADAIKTKLTVTYGEDLNIREANLGLPYLTDISYYYTVDWMGQDLYDAYTKYLQKSNSSQSEYTKNSQEILKINDRISYEENRLSLEYSLASVDSSTVGTYYTRQKNLDGSFYYSEVSLPSEYIVGVDYYSNLSTNVNEEKMSDLYKALESYFYGYYTGDSEDINQAYESLEKLTDSFKFLQKYTISYLINGLKNAKTLNEMETVVYNVLEEIWSELGRTPLKDLYLAQYKIKQEESVKAGHSDKKNDNYGYYYTTIVFITSTESAIALRDKTISGYNDQKDKIQDANAVISDSLLMRNNFTEAQLIRLSAFLREDELHIDDIVETDLDDLSSSFKIKQDAMESGRIELQKLCQPQLQFSMTMANIYALPEFEPIINQFQLGKVIKVGLRPDYIKQSRLLQVDINFDDLSDFSCEFGELTSLRTQSDIHADLLSKAITAGKSVATNSSYWTRGSDQATALDLKIQQGLLDSTTQIKAIDGNQGVVIDKYGIKLQKKNADGSIDPKQTWLVNNMILMSDDGFKTSRSALGEVTVDGQTYYGLIAEMVLSGYIESSIIKGGTIQIGEYTDVNGNNKYAFEVDRNGNVTMSSSNITGYIKEEDLYEFEKEVGDIIDNSLSGIQSQIDGTITTWFYDVPPSVGGEPSSAWNTTELKDMHLDDIYYDTKTGYCYRWQVQNGVYSWVQTLDNGLADAMLAASAAQDTADGKRRVFITTPTPPYDVGDLWSGGANGDLKRCNNLKTKGQSYSASDWELATKYTDDTSLNTFIAGTYTDNLDDIHNQIDGKARSWYQDTDPSTNWDENEDHEGDLWYDSSSDSQKTYIYNNSAWKQASVPKELFDKIDGIASIYVTLPSSPVTGDLLIPTSDIGSYKSGKVYKYNGTSWSEIDYTDTASVKTEIVKSLDGITLSAKNGESSSTINISADGIETKSANISFTGMVTFNSLKTAGSTVINGSNITTGTISADRIDATNLKVKAANIDGELTIGQLPDTVAEKDDIPTESEITTITKDTIKTTNVVAENLQIKAANVTGTLTIGQLPSTVAETSDIPTKTSLLENDSGYQDYSGVVSIAKGTITADYIKTLDLEVGNQIKMGANAKISWNNVTEQPDFATEEFVTSQGYQTESSIKSTVITKDYIETLNIKAGSVDAENISGTKLTGKTISGGEISIGSNFSVDSSGTLKALNGEIAGIKLRSQGLRYDGGTGNGFGIWKGNTHGDSGSYIIFHAGADYSKDSLASAPFRVYQNGNVVANAITCKNADIEGKVALSTGSSIGPFTTDGNSIYNGTWGASGGTPPNVFMCKGSSRSYKIGGSDQISGWAFGAGTSFGVTKDGALYASSGKIGGWSIGETNFGSDYGDILCLWGESGTRGSESYRKIGLTTFGVYLCWYDATLTEDRYVYEYKDWYQMLQ